MTNRIDVRKFGLAWGATAALLYLGCALVMATAGREGSIFFFNSLFHGIDFTSILRMGMPFWEMTLGVVEIFILGWLTGAAIAGIYNFSFNGRRSHD